MKTKPDTELISHLNFRPEAKCEIGHCNNIATTLVTTSCKCEHLLACNTCTHGFLKYADAYLRAVGNNPTCAICFVPNTQLETIPYK